MGELKDKATRWLEDNREVLVVIGIAVGYTATVFFVGMWVG